MLRAISRFRRPSPLPSWLLLRLGWLSSALLLGSCSSETPRRAASAEGAGIAAPALPGVALPGAAAPSAALPSCARASCLTPELGGLDPSDPARQRRVVAGTTAGAPSASAPSSCPGLGPELRYALDLRAFRQPAQLELGLRASFSGSLRIERGTPEDPFVVACNADQLSSGTDAFLAVTLAPDFYTVVVDGSSASDAGEFDLWLELLPRAGRCRAAPPNDRCGQATPLDPSRPQQRVAGTTECATDQAQPLWECGDFSDRRGEVFYGLDLTGRSAPTLLHASTDIEPRGADVLIYVLRDAGGECAETLWCSNERRTDGGAAELWASLPPDHYLVAIEDRAGTPNDFGLLLELGPECTVDNDTCLTARDLSPALGTQRLTAWPMCGDDSLRSTCERSGPTPDIFYRLDLRSFTAPVLVQASTSRAGKPLESLLLMGESEGTCSGELWCGDFELWLPPAVYYLALDAFRDQQGPVELSVTLSNDGAPAPAVCIDERVAQCAREFDCCDGDGEGCWLALRSCGLAAEALDCLCAADPRCCGAPGSSFDCGALLAECGTFCADFDPVVACP
ncbi:MAG TPA: hypothetical protein VFS67_27810 [Polyangiaceae bacterium]|jgi:hypothetical protein|nr:hypothetical protein [Polyangiaceae bacterium]